MAKFFSSKCVMLAAMLCAGAARGEESEILDAVSDGDVEKVRALLATDPSLANHSQDPIYKWTPLHEAAHEGSTEIVELLLAAGARVNIRNRFGESPLYCAAKRGHVGVVDQLLAKQADAAAIETRGGRTPLHAAALNGHKFVVESLLAAGANVRAKDKEGKTPLQLATAGGDQDTIELLQDYGAIASLTAAASGNFQSLGSPNNLAALKVLLKREPKWIASADAAGNTPLHWQALQGHTEVVALLLENEANVNSKNKEGKTPLHWAAYYGHKEIVETLLAHNADRDVRDTFRRTALDYANLQHHPEVAALLQPPAATQTKLVP